MSLVRALDRFTGGGPRPDSTPRCELCRQPLGADHPHVADPERRALRCACRACALLFTNPGAARGRYRTIPNRRLFDPSFAISDAQWDALEIPVGMAFFFYNSSMARWVAFYPSPAGATEAVLDLAAWQELAPSSALASRLEPDVEALLVHRPRGGAFEGYLVPVPLCYELVARVRLKWKGFDGGEDARREIAAFFENLREESEPVA